MPDPIAPTPGAQSAAIFRSLVLDPALLLARALGPGDFSRNVAEALIYKAIASGLQPFLHAHGLN